MKSNALWQDFTKRKTSPLTRMLDVVPSFCMHCLIKRAWSLSDSTLTTEAQPRDSSSKEMLPVPANKSRAETPSRSMYPFITLKIFSLAKSVVGRALNVRGMSKCLPLYCPVIILMARVVCLVGLFNPNRESTGPW